MSDHKKMLRISQQWTQEYFESFPPSNIIEFKNWLDNIVSKIPSEYSEKAEIEISCDCSGDRLIEIEIFYSRPETDYEYNCRISGEEWRKNELEKKERALLEDLKKKYES
jgi:hypothetical protein